MTDFIIRTEDIKPEEILHLYVETSKDSRVVELLKSPNPVILEGSRGTGKSFLLRVAEAQLRRDFEKTHVLPVYLSFVKSSLLQTSDKQQFLHWMLARLCSRVRRALYEFGVLGTTDHPLSILSGGTVSLPQESNIDLVAKAFEESYKNPGQAVDASTVPSVEDFKDAIEDVCRSRNINRFAFFIDEAAHIFIPDQQRQFFTLFRDLRSPFIACNAAVYPGVTSYGETFQSAHDATVEQINRDVLDPDYISNMREIVFKQSESHQMEAITAHGENFAALAFAVSGNPRLLLKTVAKTPGLRTNDVQKVLKEFYRTEIWSEHSGLVERFPGHKPIIDWGRQFVETTVIPDAREKNATREADGKEESTSFFWVHKDAPTIVKEALRLLTYTGIVSLMDSYIVATRSQVGSRYSLNLGCLSAAEANPISYLGRIGKTLNIKRFTEYGADHESFKPIVNMASAFNDSSSSAILSRQLAKPIGVLDLTEFQKEGLSNIGLETVGKALNATEEQFQKIYYVGPKRSRQMKNVVVSSILEYLSG